MARPWMWLLTEDGRAHATAAEAAAGVEISAVCGAMVVGCPQPVVHGDPCLSCLQLVGAPTAERVGVR